MTTPKTQYYAWAYHTPLGPVWNTHCRTDGTITEWLTSDHKIVPVPTGVSLGSVDNQAVDAWHICDEDTYLKARRLCKPLVVSR